MQLGDTFLMPIPDQQIDHLWIVLSDPDRGSFVVVNVTKDVARAGGECPITPKDHPWIKESSFVNFADAIEITQAKASVLSALVGNLVTMQARLETKVVERIVLIAKKSKAFPIAFRKYL